MPGRLAIYDDANFKKDCKIYLGILKDNIKTLTPRYNLAPTNNIPVFLNTALYTYAHFGLITSWAKDKSNININARCESIFEKSSFKDAIKTKRAIIPINGYYEWQKDHLTNRSIPYIIEQKNKKEQNYLALAAIYDTWYDEKIEKYILTTAIITCEPNKTISKLHDRMPVVLEKKDWKTWLSKHSDYQTINSLLKPCSDEVIGIQQVSDLVNSIKNDSPKCLDKNIKFKKADNLFDI